MKPEAQTPGPASESALAAATKALIHFPPSCLNGLPASVTDYADSNTNAPYVLELCDTFTQGQTISQDVADYIHATTKDQARSADLRNGCPPVLCLLLYSTNARTSIQLPPITYIMGYKTFTE